MGNLRVVGARRDGEEDVAHAHARAGRIVRQMRLVVPLDLLRRDVDPLPDLAVHELRLLDLGLHARAIGRHGQPLGSERVAETLVIHAVSRLDLVDVAADLLVPGGDTQGGDLLLEQLVGDERVEQRPLLHPFGAAFLPIPPQLEGRDRLPVDGRDDPVDDLRPTGARDEE